MKIDRKKIYSLERVWGLILILTNCVLRSMEFCRILNSKMHSMIMFRQVSISVTSN